MSDELSISKAKRDFEEIIKLLRDETQKLVKTREGRDLIRRELGCRIDGYEDEEVGGIPPGLFNSPMQ